MSNTIILIGLFFCHFLADYTQLSRPFMLSAKKFGTPIFPIFLHASVHATLMSCFLLFFTDWKTVLFLYAFQAVSHTLIDILKGRINFYFPQTREISDVKFWIVFGFDQFLHALIIILMAKCV